MGTHNCSLPACLVPVQVWIGQGDIVLLGLRDYQDDKADVILKYTADEARVLKQYGELPENIRINDTDIVMEGEDNENAGGCARMHMRVEGPTLGRRGQCVLRPVCMDVTSHI